MANEPDLHPNTSGEWVVYLQQKLNAAGFACPQDGSFDEATLDALHQYQNAVGLAQTDVVDQATWSSMDVAASGAAEASYASSEGTGGGGGGSGAGGDGPGNLSGTFDDGTGGGSGAGPGPSGPGPSAYSIDAAELWPDCQTVMMWVNAFIPGDVAGAFDGVGDSSGHRLIPGLPLVGDCYYTDSRTWSTEPAAHSRMHALAVVDIRNGELVHQEFACGETVEADCEDGSIDCRDTATPSGGFANVAYEGNTITLGVSGSASNPCLSISFDADFLGTFTVDVENHSVSFDGMVDVFPAYECYAAVNYGAGVEVFTYGPSGAAPDLAGGASDAVAGTAQL